MFIKVASIQYRAVAANIAENISALSTLITEAAGNGAKIIVLPEMCTTGLYILNIREARILAEPIPGPSTYTFSNLAISCNVYIVLGIAEYNRTTNKFYNSQIIIDPSGRIISKYRKMNLFGPDHNWAKKGNLGYKAVDVGLCKIGLGICFDINFKDFLEFMSNSNIDILAFSTNWVGDDLPFLYWSEMISAGNYYLIAANNWGEDGDIHFSGGSIILSPNLTILSKSVALENTVIYATIRIDR